MSPVEFHHPRLGLMPVFSAQLNLKLHLSSVRFPRLGRSPSGLLPERDERRRPSGMERVAPCGGCLTAASVPVHFSIRHHLKGSQA